MNNVTNKNKILEKAKQLLPWYALDLLTPEENDYIENLLLEYPELQVQLKAEFDTISFLKKEQDLLQLSAIESSEKRLERLLKNETFDANQPSIKHKIFTFIQSLATGDLAGVQYLGFAVISTLSIGLLFAFIAPLLEQKNTFYPAFSESTNDSSKPNTTNLLIGINVSLSDPRLTVLFKDIHAKVTAIPGKEGMYRMTFLKKLSSANLKITLQKLSANKELFWFVGESY